MINTWEHIYGKAVKKEARKVAVEWLQVSQGGQGPTVGITRMSRGRHKEEAYGLTQPRSPKHKDGGRAQNARRDWYLQDCEVRKPVKETLFQRIGNEIGVERIFKQCLQNADKDPLLKPLIPLINLPLAKTLVAYLLGQPMPDFAVTLPALKLELIKLRDEYEFTKPHFDSISSIFQRGVHSLCHTNESKLLWDTVSMCFKKEIEMGSTKTTDKRFVTWEISIDLQGLGDISTSLADNNNATTRGRNAIRSIVNDRDLAYLICQAAKKSVPDPEIARAVNRCFATDDIEFLEISSRGNQSSSRTENQIRISFQILPEQYEDRITLRGLDLAHNKTFITALQEELLLRKKTGDPKRGTSDNRARSSGDIKGETTSSPGDNNIAGSPGEKKSPPARTLVKKSDDWQTKMWKEEAEGMVSGFDNINMTMAEHSSYDGASLENELALALSPLLTYPALPRSGGGTGAGSPGAPGTIVFDEQNRRISMLEDQLKRLASIHSRELCRTRKMLVLAKERIQELEELTSLLPAEAAQAQSLIFRITQDSLKRTFYKASKGGDPDSTPRCNDPDDDSPDRGGRDGSHGLTSPSSMEVIESCPTPRLFDHLYGEGFDPNQDLHFGTHPRSTNNMPADSRHYNMKSPEYNNHTGNNYNTDESFYSSAPGPSRLAPGESIDEKLREWLDACKRLLDEEA